jgi:hypothetical protein
MPLAIRMLLLASLLAAPAANGVGRVEGQAAGRRFVSVKYGFSISVPPGWGVSTALDTPVYFFASPSQRFVQDAIPRGGAVIAVESHDTTSGLSGSAKTARDWAVADTQAAATGSPVIAPFEMPKESGTSGAVESSYDEETFSPDERRKHCVAVFWKFGGELFAARLRFNAGDSIGPTLTTVFLQTVRSIRPFKPTAQARW